MDNKTDQSMDKRRIRFALRPQEVQEELNQLLDLYWGGPERRVTGLTLRIMGMNAIALLILAIGVLYLGQYQNNLIEDKLATFKSQTEIVATALSKSAGDLRPTADMVEALASHMPHRIRVFDTAGFLIIDTQPPQAPPSNGWSVRSYRDIGQWIVALLPSNKSLPAYPHIRSERIEDYPDVQKAAQGFIELSAWSDQGDILLSAAAPLPQEDRAGVVLLTRHAHDIKDALGEIWIDVLNIFLGTLLLTIVLSIYFSGLIANPLKKLSRAAEDVRAGKASADVIPDLSARHDEIGELSLVLRAMTRALYDRMDSIERFAADVAHELKNPLTSLSSAVETLAIVTKKADREKMMAVIKHDVERLDRLVSDISEASRLDAELSREAFEPIDMRDILTALIDLYRDPLHRDESSALQAEHQGKMIALAMLPGQSVRVDGSASRLMQVFQNLLANALSFSKEGDSIEIALEATGSIVRVYVRDQGPGIPETKLDSIFERFYSERPDHEEYGRHSGLGLSICRQIINAHSGTIEAHNITDKNGSVIGAQFTVTLKRYER